MTERLLTTQQAAELLNISIGSLRNMTAAKEIPFIRIGKRRVRFSAEALSQWAKACTVEATNGK